MTESQRRSILVDVVQTFGRMEWFRDATVWDSYPTNGVPTLEFKVNYVPVFERTQILTFVAKYNLQEKFTVVNREGKPVE